MNHTHVKALSIFYPELLKKIQELDKSTTKFVLYTSAETAMSIIINEEVWLRNVRCMNDYLEVEHGIRCLVNAFNSKNEGEEFQGVLEELFPGIIEEIRDVFEGWIPHFRSSTYILCVSEHPSEEDQYGRLSMWRAYGGKQSVAIVMNRNAFRSETDAFATNTAPVYYSDADKFTSVFSNLAKRIKSEREFISELGKDVVIKHLFGLFKTYALCVKHPGFHEEREWRVVYNPEIEKSKHVVSSIESIDGIPQEVYKIPLKNIPDENFNHATIPELIHRIIIGPNDHQEILGDTFEKMLKDAGCENPNERIHYSGIPLK